MDRLNLLENELKKYENQRLTRASFLRIDAIKEEYKQIYSALPREYFNIYFNKYITFLRLYKNLKKSVTQSLTDSKIKCKF